MKNGFLPCLRGELWKVFHARALYVTLAVGFLIQLYNVGCNIGYVQMIYDAGTRHVDAKSLYLLVKRRRKFRLLFVSMAIPAVGADTLWMVM